MALQIIRALGHGVPAHVHAAPCHQLGLSCSPPPTPVCPLACQQVTQLGHVKDLATAFVKALGNRRAYNQIYNISGVLE